MLMKVGSDHLSYVFPFTATDVGDESSAINTEFFLDHSSIPAMIEQAVRSGTPWLLGDLKPGWEWFAFTFNDQEQIKLTAQEIQDMIAASDEVVRQAYSRMKLDKNHSWTRHSAKEVDFICRECRIGPEASILDLGCGTGRHSLQLAERQFCVTGVDYIAQFIDAANSAAASEGLPLATFLDADCRKLQLRKTFDAVICLYDVIGSFAERSENFKILRTIARHLKSGGYTLISVMNGVLTRKIAKYRFSLKQDASQLLLLKPSRTMEKTGNIFDPEYFMLDDESGVVYRKEQFESGTSLPAELVVRDRRYGAAEIAAELSAVGLNVLWTRCVRAGDWDTALDETDERAKEILILCSKP
jgi:2-polyprenyl-3-methyl-5-hydroxy-6-metoxy-1,4-benzoquinol methylase